MTGIGKRLNPDQPSAVSTTTKLTHEQRQRVEMAAKQQNLTVSAYIRAVLEKDTQRQTTA